MRHATLFIVSGLPGAGKTTHALALEAQTGAVRMEPDGWLAALDLDLWDENRRAAIEALQWTLSRRYLAAGVDVIVEWGSWGRAERLALAAEAKALGARAELHWLTAPLEVLLERLAARGREDPPITRADLAGWIAAFEAPDAAERRFYDAVRRL